MKAMIKPKVTFTIDLELSEGEARALDALAGYGADAFLKTFYEHMGRAYLEPFEKDLRQLFTKIEELRSPIAKIHEAREKLGLPRVL